MSTLRTSAPRIVRATAIAVVYCLAWLALDALSSRYTGSASSSPWSLGAALTFYLIYTFGPRYAPLAILAALLRGFFLGHDAPMTYQVLIALGTQQALIYGFAAVLLRRGLHVRVPFLEFRDLMLYLAVTTGAAVAAGFSSVALLVASGATPGSDFYTQVMTWVTGDLVGFLTLVPILAAFLTPAMVPSLVPPPEPPGRKVRLYELGVVLALLVASAIIGYRWLESGSGALVYYFLFLPLVWLAVRGGLRMAAIGIICADLTIVAFGLWYHMTAAEALLFQSYVAASALTALTLGTLTSQRWREESTAIERARHDNITGLPNPQALDAWLRDPATAATGPLTLMLFNIDNMLMLSEGLPRNAIDEFVRGISDRLRSIPMRRLYLAHTSDRGFGIVMQGNDVRSVELVAEKIRAAFENPILAGDTHIYAAFSIGAATCEAGEDPTHLILHAAEALDRARARTADVHFYVGDKNREPMISLASQLHTAFLEEQFDMFFQPIFSGPSVSNGNPAREGRIVGAEALLRWNHPKRGLLTPAAFLDLLDSMSLAEQVGSWTFERVCRSQAQWRALGLDMVIYVNVFARQLLNPGFPAALQATMARYGLEPDRIVVEITERMIARGEDEIIAAAMRLRERNISVAIDDFGTGQSSFLRLRDFEFNILKIDQSFVQGIGDDRSGGVVTSLLGMAHDLGTTSLAEGIENAGQLRFLLDGGCQLVQGFHLGLPTPAQEFQSVVARSLEAHNTDNVRQGAPPDERFGGLPQFPTNKPGFAGGY